MITIAQLEIDRLLDREGAIAVARHPELARAVAWLAERGRLTRALPGVYVRSTEVGERRTRIWALLQWDPTRS